MIGETRIRLDDPAETAHFSMGNLWGLHVFAPDAPNKANPRGRGARHCGLLIGDCRFDDRARWNSGAKDDKRSQSAPEPSPTPKGQSRRTKPMCGRCRPGPNKPPAPNEPNLGGRAKPGARKGISTNEANPDGRGAWDWGLAIADSGFDTRHGRIVSATDAKRSQCAAEPDPKHGKRLCRTNPITPGARRDWTSRLRQTNPICQRSRLTTETRRTPRKT